METDFFFLPKDSKSLKIRKWSNQILLYKTAKIKLFENTVNMIGQKKLFANLKMWN